jgi:hypothetical protein
MINIQCTILNSHKVRSAALKNGIAGKEEMILNSSNKELKNYHYPKTSAHAGVYFFGITGKRYRCPAVSHGIIYAAAYYHKT